MNKASHVSLTKYLMNSEGMEELKRHGRAFCIGGILPDLKPSFLYRRHTIEASFGSLKKEIDRLINHFDSGKGMDRYFCRHLGVVTHYVADFFTFPHNSIYPGKFVDHCRYEQELMKKIRLYEKSAEAKRQRSGVTIHGEEEILDFVKRMHEIYVRTKSVVKRDCEYILCLCHTVVDALLSLFECEKESSTYLSECRAS